MIHAGADSAAMHYLKANEADKTDAVLDQMRKTPVNDLFAKNCTIRKDRPHGARHVPDPGEEAVGIRQLPATCGMNVATKREGGSADAAPPISKRNGDNTRAPRYAVPTA